MILETLIFTLFYLFLWKYMEIPLEPVNYLSVIHAFCTVIVFGLYGASSYYIRYLIFIHSFVYFGVDYIQTNEKIWKIHHFLSMINIAFGLIFDIQLQSSVQSLFWMEVGGCLYHISRIFPQNKWVRQLFIFSYIGSRLACLPSAYDFVMLTLQITFTFVNSISLFWNIFAFMNLILGLSILAMNGWFIQKQIQKYFIDFP